MHINLVCVVCVLCKEYAVHTYRLMYVRMYICTYFGGEVSGGAGGEGAQAQGMDMVKRDGPDWRDDRLGERSGTKSSGTRESTSATCPSLVQVASEASPQRADDIRGDGSSQTLPESEWHPVGQEVGDRLCVQSHMEHHESFNPVLVGKMVLVSLQNTEYHQATGVLGRPKADSTADNTGMAMVVIRAVESLHHVMLMLAVNFRTGSSYRA